MPYDFVEFPKWLHAKGRKSVLVDDRDTETAQLDAWFAEDAAKLASLGNVITLVPASNAPVGIKAEPKKGGWPKGKPRARKAV